MNFKSALIFLLGVLPLAAFELPANCSQCIVGTAADWNSSSVTLCLYEKVGKDWKPAAKSWAGRLGSKGLVWGNGIHPVPAGALTKKEGDDRSPAGVFRIGGAWGDAASIQKRPNQFYRQVTSRDLWVEDPASPDYNKNVIIDHEPATAWEKKQQMRQNDPAHELKLFIAHNAAPNARPNAGSAIFFHIWRGGGSKATVACTSMEKSRLQWMVAQIDPSKKPLYVLLPKAEYEKRRVEWKLP